MATEPERPIEELLREAAKKRGEQAGGPFELPPATRRILQTEVSRKFEKRAEDEPAPGLSLLQLLPRLIWGATICGVLALMIWIVVPKSQRETKEGDIAQLSSSRQPAPPATAPAPEPQADSSAVASAEPASPADAKVIEDLAAMDKAKTPSVEPENSPRQAAPPPVTRETQPGLAMQPPTEAAKKLKAADSENKGAAPVEESRSTVTAMTDRSAKDSAASATPNFSTLTNEIAMTPAKQEMIAPVTAAAPPAPRAAAAPLSRSAQAPASAAGPNVASFRTDAPATQAFIPSAGTLAKSVDALTNGERPQAAAAPQQFYRLSPDQEKKENATAAGNRPPAVLTAFRVEQSGSELRIIDSDGSVYKGYVQPATAAARRRAISGYTGTTRALRAPGQDEAAISGGAPASEHGMQDYAFSVSGTSATLHKKVTFRGTLNTLSPLTLYKVTTAAGTNLGGVSGAAGAEGAVLNNARVSGTVSVSGAKDFDIEAATKSP